MDYLEVVDGQGKRRRISLDRPRLLIGREPTCDIQLPHPGVSRRHAQLQQTEQGRWLLQDLSSRNHIYLDNRPVAALVYQRQQHMINLFLWPATPDVAPEETRRTRHGYNLIHWTTADMTYWAVSNLNMRELQEFVSLVQQSAMPSRAIQ